MTAHRPHDPVSPEVAAAATRLTGTPEQLAARLRALLDEGPPKPGTRESADARREREAETAAHERTVAALRHRLATDFAEARGWRITPAPFAVKELARRSAGGNWHRPPREWPGTMFHSAFYRDAARRAVAMVAHPLAAAVEQGQLEVELWAAERDLTVTFIAGASWQDPARNVLAVFEPVEPVAIPAPAEPAPGPAAVGTGEPAAAISQIPAAPEASEPAQDMSGNITGPAAVPVMRPVASISLDGITPRDLTDEKDPDFDVVDPTDLLIDEAYQRGLSPRSLTLIRRIIETWSWAKFKVPTCVRVDGRLHVIDGQHSVIAAASHPGIQAVPVLIAKVPAVADRAAAFVSHATNRLQATAVQIHRAALTAGDEEAVQLDAVCRAAGVEMLPFPPSGTVPYRPRQTVAVVGIRRLIARRGAERATEILACLAAAEVAPISGDFIRLAEALLCDEQYAGGFDAESLSAALRGLTAKTQAEARELAIAQRLAPWRALAAVLYRNRSKPTTGRRRAAA